MDKEKQQKKHVGIYDEEIAEFYHILEGNHLTI